MFRTFLPENWEPTYRFLQQKPFYNFDLIGKLIERKDDPQALKSSFRVYANPHIGGVIYKSSFILSSFLTADCFDSLRRYVSRCSRFASLQGPYPFMRQLVNELPYLQKFATVWRHLQILSISQESYMKNPFSADFALELAGKDQIYPISIMEKKLYQQEIPSSYQPPLPIFLEAIEEEIEQHKIWIHKIDHQVVFKLNVRTIANYSIIESVFTVPEFRRRGLAWQGMQKICEILFKQGNQAVFLKVNQKNPAAQKLYEKLGFHPSGETLSLHFN